MENFLKTLEVRSEPDRFEITSILAFLAQLDSSVTPTELEIAANLTYNVLKTLYGPNNYIWLPYVFLQNFVKFLEENEARSTITFHNSRLKLHIHDKTLFQVILLTSLKSNRELFLSNKTNEKGHNFELFMQQILIYTVKYIDSKKAHSVYLLQVLQLILKTYSRVVPSVLKTDILKLTTILSLSQINNFKYYSRNISNLVLESLTQNELNQLFSLNLLPIRGIETSNLLEYANKDMMDSVEIENTVEKILRMFRKNIENRDAGFLYEYILKNFSSFSDWQQQIWPLFAPNLERIDQESEFFQSFVKYWIPQNIGIYKTDFYTFIRDTSVDKYLKAYILLETRKKGFYNKDIFNRDLLDFFSEPKTSITAMKICTTFHKRTVYPDAYELGLVKNVLYSFPGEYLEVEHTKALEQFFSHIFICSHHICNATQNDVSLNVLLTLYRNFFRDILEYCCALFRTPNFEVGAQVVKIFWSTASGCSKNLKLTYKLEEKFAYEVGGNSFYSFLESEKVFDVLRDQNFIENLQSCLKKIEGSCPNLTKLVLHRYITEINIFDNFTLMDIVEELYQKMSLKSADSLRNYAEIYFAKLSPDEKLQFEHNLLRILKNNLETCCETQTLCDISLIFKNVLILETILVLINQDVISAELYRVVQKCMDLVEHILDEGIVGKLCERENLKEIETYGASKVQKVVESFINNILHCLLTIKTIWHNINKPIILQQLRKIIKISNMKKPVTLSADVLKHFGSIMDLKHSDDHNLKIEFLNKVLSSIYESSEVQSLKIRRSPETRLVVHAMCSSENAPQKSLLTWSINSLINIISDESSSNSAISSALHCLEYLTSDTNFHSTTLLFIPKIILKCVELFESTSWIVRNADLQLIKSIIDRFYGVIISESNRPKNIEDLFHLFPELAVPFYKTLARTPQTDGAVIVLQFFAVSQIKKQPFSFDYLEITRECFLKMFIKIIKTDASTIGLRAVSAYTALCFEEDIPEIFEDTVEYLADNLAQIRRKNVFRNFATLLEKLFKKYTSSFECYINRKNNEIKIRNSLDRFSEILASLNPVQVDFLLLKNKALNQIFDEIKLVKNGDFKSRIWQQNYLPSLILNCPSDNLELVLQKVFSVEILDCVKVQILSVLLKKFSTKEFDTKMSSNVLNILVNDMTKIVDDNVYVLNCYFKVILLFFEHLNPCDIFSFDSQVYDKVRNSYDQVQNVYKIMVYLIVISNNVKNRINSDRDFIQRIKYFYVNVDLSNKEIVEDISLILKYLYKCVSCSYDKYRVFKIAIYIMLTHGIFDFVVYITKSKIKTVLEALCKILDFDLLTKCIRNESLVKKLVADTYSFVVFSNSDTKNECLTFYTREIEVFIPQYFLEIILEKFVKDSSIKY